jgi:ankyrin repeat protein
MNILDAAKSGDVAAVRRAIEADPAAVAWRDAQGETALMAALYRGHHEIVDLLIASGAPLDVFAAAATGRVAELETAIVPGASLAGYSYDGWTALHLAAFFGHVEAVRLLLDAGAPVSAVSSNSMRNTPLHAASAGGHSASALLLIERGADVHAADAGGHTPLHIAAENGLADVVRALVAAGADPHAVDAEQKTPLSRAAARNHNDIVDLINDPR